MAPKVRPDKLPPPSVLRRRVGQSNGNGDISDLERIPIPEDELERIRKDLFLNGSEFLPTKRSDIVGIDQVLQEIDDVIHCLQYHKDYRKYGSRLEPGIILEGRPGTGKTLVSRYIASESNALFVNVRDWPHNEALFTAEDIAALFKQARATYKQIKRPIILFWDEFEANACERSEASPEQATAVSQLTAELDGIHGKNEGLLLIGCTNYIGAIDDALLRSGRMGVHIEFVPPDRAGKRQLLTHYLSQSKTRGKIDVETLSYFFDSSATAADIEEACVEAWRYGVRRALKAGEGRPSLTQADLMEVFVKRLVGPPTMFVNLELEKRARIAVHECGHAIMCLVYGIPLRLITVQPGKNCLGHVIFSEIEEHLGTLDEVVNNVRVYLGSIAAEEVAGLPQGVSVSGDIQQANEAAHRLIDALNYGSSGTFNLISLSESRGSHSMEPPRPNISERRVEMADTEIAALLQKLEDEAKRTLRLIGKERLWAIANEVNERVTMTGKEFEELFAKVVKEPIDSLRA